MGPMNNSYVIKFILDLDEYLRTSCWYDDGDGACYRSLKSIKRFVFVDILNKNIAHKEPATSSFKPGAVNYQDWYSRDILKWISDDQAFCVKLSILQKKGLHEDIIVYVETTDPDLIAGLEAICSSNKRKGMQ